MVECWPIDAVQFGVEPRMHTPTRLIAIVSLTVSLTARLFFLGPKLIMILKMRPELRSGSSAYPLNLAFQSGAHDSGAATARQ